MADLRKRRRVGFIVGRRTEDALLVEGGVGGGVGGGEPEVTSPRSESSFVDELSRCPAGSNTGGRTIETGRVNPNPEPTEVQSARRVTSLRSESSKTKKHSPNTCARANNTLHK